MKPDKMPLLQLVALVRQPPPEEVILHRGVRERLAELMPRTSLATAWQTMREIEQGNKAAGCEALRLYPWSPPLEPAEPDPPRPASEADLVFAAHLMSPSVVLHHRVREELVEHLARGPVGPAIWRMREIVWAARTPAVGGGPEIEPIAALDAWCEAGELVDELAAPGRSGTATAASSPSPSRLRPTPTGFWVKPRTRPRPWPPRRRTYAGKTIR